jgi:hypothetical protein
MSNRTVTLKPAHLEHLRQGKHVWWDDNTGQEVLLLPDGTDPGEAYEGAKVVGLSPADVKNLSDDPEGVLVFNFANFPDSSILVEVAR